MKSKYTLEIKNLKKSYGRVDVLKDISFSLKSGEITGLLGANGAGKSTLMKCICGLLRHDGGEILLNGELLDLKNNDLTFSALIDTNFLDYLSIYENLYVLGLYAGLDKKTLKREIDYLLNLMGIADKKKAKPTQLSFGQLQKTAVAQALLGKSDFLILDEPTVGLDGPSVEVMRKEIIKRAEAGTGVLLSSHEYKFLEDLCDKFVIIDAGKVVYDAPLSKEMFIEIRSKEGQEKNLKEQIENLSAVASISLKREFDLKTLYYSKTAASKKNNDYTQIKKELGESDADIN